MTPFEQAIKKAGGRAALAKALGRTRATIYNWKKVPAELVVKVEKVTGISRQKLRPDLFAGMK